MGRFVFKHLMHCDCISVLNLQFFLTFFLCQWGTKLIKSLNWNCDIWGLAELEQHPMRNRHWDSVCYSQFFCTLFRWSSVDKPLQRMQAGVVIFKHNFLCKKDLIWMYVCNLWGSAFKQAFSINPSHLRCWKLTWNFESEHFLPFLFIFLVPSRH